MNNIIKRFFYKENKKMSMRSSGRNIEISENHTQKTFTINGTIQSLVMKNSDYTMEYWDMFPPLAYVFENPRVLMIGLGGGTIAHQISANFGSRVQLEIFEVDANIADMSKRFFGLNPATKIVIGDGAVLLSKKRAAYDIIILDAYDVDTIPAQFLTAQFVRNASNALKGAGILAINYISTMGHGGMLENYVNILSEHFSVYLINARGITSNSIIICSKSLKKEEIVDKIRSSIGAGSYKSMIVSNYENMERGATEKHWDSR